MNSNVTSGVGTERVRKASDREGARMSHEGLRTRLSKSYVPFTMFDVGTSERKLPLGPLCYVCSPGGDLGLTGEVVT